ncbi:MAG: sulfite exporter TauE/SafE family protein [Chloroflexota bacterium]
MLALLTLGPLELTTDLSVISLAVLTVATFILAYLAGMVGMALGVILLPLMLFLGVDPLTAAGTNLAVSVTIAIAGGWLHYRAGRVANRIVLLMGVPALVGSFVGAQFSTAVSVWMLMTLIGVVLAWSGLVGVVRGLSAERAAHLAAGEAANPAKPSGPGPKRLTLETAVGFAIGVAGGAVGLVLGTVRMPALVNVLKLTPAMAIGTNTVIGLLVGVFGFIGHALHGNYDLTLVVTLGVISMGGSFLGARRTGKLKPDALRLTIGATLLGIAPVMFYRAIVSFPD